MPLPHRSVAPASVSRGCLPLDPHGRPILLGNELDQVANGTLANLIRQLASISRQADDIFGSLIVEATDIFKRTSRLHVRLTNLREKVDQLNDAEETTGDLHADRKPFTSIAIDFEQQLFTPDSRPNFVVSTHSECGEPPALNKMNPYRDDGRECLSFYTDCSYFFELWKRQMLEDNKKLLQARHARRPKRQNLTSTPKSLINTPRRPNQVPLRPKQPPPAPPTSNTGEFKRKSNEYAAVIPTTKPVQGILNSLKTVEETVSSDLFPGNAIQEQKTKDNEMLNEAPALPTSSAYAFTFSPTSEVSSTPENPLPEDAASTDDFHDFPAPPTPNTLDPPTVVAVPAPPEPPPMPGSMIVNEDEESKACEQKMVIENEQPNRNDLLAAIRRGVSLKKVDVKTNDKTIVLGVAEILARRVAIECTDEEEDEEEDDGPEQNWDE